jgi:hypothetical protein
MKNLILSLGMFMIFILNAYPQKADSAITIERRQFHQNGKIRTFPQVKMSLANNQASASEYQKYKVNNTIAIPFVIVGSVGIIAGAAITLVSSVKQSQDVNNGELNGTYSSGLGIVLIGAAFDIVALPFLFSANKHFKQSINNYNSSLKSTQSEPVQFNLMVRGNGLGIRMVF